jgi:hypothetical protein
MSGTLKSRIVVSQSLSFFSSYCVNYIPLYASRKNYSIISCTKQQAAGQREEDNKTNVRVHRLIAHVTHINL